MQPTQAKSHFTCKLFPIVSMQVFTWGSEAALLPCKQNLATLVDAV